MADHTQALRDRIVALEKRLDDISGRDIAFNEFVLPLAYVTSVAPATGLPIYSATGTTIYIPVSQFGFTPYYTRAAILTNVAAPNDAANYWNIRIVTHLTNLTGGITIAEVNTDLNAAATWNDQSGAVSVSSPINNQVIRGRLEKFGAPGNLSLLMAIHFRSDPS